MTKIEEGAILLDENYDAETHTYTVLGHVVPSVTQLVAPLGEDYDEPDDLTEGVIDAATERGTIMHAYIAHRLTGGAPEDFELPDAYSEYADAVERFLAEHDITPMLIETPLYSIEYAGTPDLICEFDGVLSILDWKFVSQIAKSKVGAQLGGYRMLCELNKIFPEKLIAVQFTRGSYRLYPAAPDAALQAFFDVRRVYALKTAKHPRGRIFEEAKHESA